MPCAPCCAPPSSTGERRSRMGTSGRSMATLATSPTNWRSTAGSVSLVSVAARRWSGSKWVSVAHSTAPVVSLRRRFSPLRRLSRKNRQASKQERKVVARRPAAPAKHGTSYVPRRRATPPRSPRSSRERQPAHPWAYFGEERQLRGRRSATTKSLRMAYYAAMIASTQATREVIRMLLADLSSCLPRQWGTERLSILYWPGGSSSCPGSPASHRRTSPGDSKRPSAKVSHGSSQTLIAMPPRA